MTRRRQLIAFALLCAVCIAGAVAYALHAEQGVTSVRADDTTPTGQDPDAAAVALAAKPHVLFRSTTIDSRFGSIGVLGLGDLSGTPAWSDLRCERVAFAAERGLCLSVDRGAMTTYSVIVFDEHLQPLFTNKLPGLPSRARISPDGHYGATTTFVSGDSYAADTFSTRTEILDLDTGHSLGDLEQFTVEKDGAPIDAIDHNFWGVTFVADSNRFYATLGTGGHRYLVEGDLAARRMVVLRDGVECPSLSPDNTRIAFKKREDAAGGRIQWQLSVLDLATLEDHPLAETASVDDQAEWLDDATVLYSLPTVSSGTPTKDTWGVPADGTGTPRRVLDGAYSTTVVRTVR